LVVFVVVFVGLLLRCRCLRLFTFRLALSAIRCCVLFGLPVAFILLRFVCYVCCCYVAFTHLRVRYVFVYVYVVYVYHVRGCSFTGDLRLRYGFIWFTLFRLLRLRSRFTCCVGYGSFGIAVYTFTLRTAGLLVVATLRLVTRCYGFTFVTVYRVCTVVGLICFVYVGSFRSRLVYRYVWFIVAFVSLLCCSGCYWLRLF